jgi:GTP-binding protein
VGANRPHSGPDQRLDVTFIASAPDLARCPEPDGPEIAFAGRSNAGKSSALNRLTGNRHTARVSKTPGRTQLLNFFGVAGGGRFVDLPGYGYAKAARSSQQAWQRNVNEFLSRRDALTAIVLVTDIRHPGQPYDLELLEWADASELPLLLLLSKADKLKRNAQNKALQAALKATRDMPLVQVQLFSAQSGLGKDAVIDILRGWLQPE